MDGTVDCSLGDDGVVDEGESCTVACHIGFELQGSTSRTCQADGIWSGTETICEEGMDSCSVLKHKCYIPVKPYFKEFTGTVW